MCKLTECCQFPRVEFDLLVNAHHTVPPQKPALRPISASRWAEWNPYATGLLCGPGAAKKRAGERVEAQRPGLRSRPFAVAGSDRRSLGYRAQSSADRLATSPGAASRT